MTPERKYKKGLNAAISTKFDYSISDIQMLIDSEILSLELETVSENVEKIRKLLRSKVFSSDAGNYIDYQLSKGNFEETIGFIRGSLMNSLVKDISDIIVIDEEKFRQEIKSSEVQAILIMTVQAMMQGKKLNELYEPTEGSYEMSAKDYLDSIRNKLNLKLDEILRKNEYGISKPAKDIALDFNGIPDLLMDGFKKQISVSDDVKISALAVRSILTAA
jgi:hypothetical protein